MTGMLYEAQLYWKKLVNANNMGRLLLFYVQVGSYI